MDCLNVYLHIISPQWQNSSLVMNLTVSRQKKKLLDKYWGWNVQQSLAKAKKLACIKGPNPPVWHRKVAKDTASIKWWLAKSTSKPLAQRLCTCNGNTNGGKFKLAIKSVSIETNSHGPATKCPNSRPISSDQPWAAANEQQVGVSWKKEALLKARVHQVSSTRKGVLD